MKKEKIKSLLLKIVNVKTTYLATLVTISLLLVTICFSYALFTASVEKKGVLNVTAANLYAIVAGDELNNNTITVGSNEKKQIEITVENINSIDATYHLYYKVLSGSNVTVGVGECTDSAENYTGAFTISKYGSNNKKTITIVIENKSSESVSVEIGSKVGLPNKPLTLQEGEHQLEVVPCSSAETPESCFAFNNGKITGYNDTDSDGNACPKDVIIPKTIGGINVTKIGIIAFDDKQLTSVVIPEGVTTIGANSFRNNQLTSVVIPEGVTSIGMSAFESNQLTSVVIPSSVTKIDLYAFYENQLTSVTIKGKSSPLDFEDLDTIEAFSWAEGYGNTDIIWELSSAQVPPESCFTFYDDGSIIGYNDTDSEGNECPRSVNIPKTINGKEVEAIGPEAFANAGLTSVSIPKGVTSIGEAAFYGNQLTSVVIPSSVTSIGEAAFLENNLQIIEIPSSVTSIGAGAFCSNPFEIIVIYGKSDPSDFESYGDGIWNELDDRIFWLP